MTYLAGALLFMMANVQSEAVPFDSGRWRIGAAEHRVEEHLGRKSLFLHDGMAAVADACKASSRTFFLMIFRVSSLPDSGA